MSFSLPFPHYHHRWSGKILENRFANLKKFSIVVHFLFLFKNINTSTVKKYRFTYFRNIHRGKLASTQPNRRHANGLVHKLSMNLGQRRHMFRKIHGMPSKRHPDLGNCAVDTDSHKCWKDKVHMK